MVAPPTAHPDRPVTKSLEPAGRHGQNGGGRDGWGGGGAGGSGEHGIGESEGNAAGSGASGGGCGHWGGSGGRGGGGRGGGGRGGGSRGGGGRSSGGRGGGGRGGIGRTGRGRGGGGTSGGDMEKAVGRNGEHGNSHIELSHQGDITDVHSSQDNGLKVRVSGKRRVWGTLNVTPACVVKRSISNLAGEAPKHVGNKKDVQKATQQTEFVGGTSSQGMKMSLVSLEKKWEAVKDWVEN